MSQTISLNHYVKWPSFPYSSRLQVSLHSFYWQGARTIVSSSWRRQANSPYTFEIMRELFKITSAWLVVALILPLVILTLSMAKPSEAGWPGSSFRLTVDVSPLDSGNVEVDSAVSSSYPATYDYPAGETVSLKAIPSPGYRFVGWSGNLTGKSESTSIEMTCNKSITANFINLPSSPFAWWWIVIGVVAIGLPIYFLTIRRSKAQEKWHYW